MQAYKGFNEKLQCTWGKGTFTYEPGITYVEQQSKTASTGFHCAEYIPDCFKYYSPNGKNRFFLVEAGGSIDEEAGDSKIACTQITLMKELNLKQMTIACMMYIVRHPGREWKTAGSHYMIAEKKAYINKGIAIARGMQPQAKGDTGSILGLLFEKDGQIMQAKAVEVDGIQIKTDTWYTISEGGEIHEIQGN